MNPLFLYNYDASARPHIPMDYARKDYLRATDRPAEHGPQTWGTFERIFWTAGGLVLVAFWVAVLVEVVS